MDIGRPKRIIEVEPVSLPLPDVVLVSDGGGLAPAARHPHRPPVFQRCIWLSLPDVVPDLEPATPEPTPVEPDPSRPAP